MGGSNRGSRRTQRAEGDTEGGDGTSPAGTEDAASGTTSGPTHPAADSHAAPSAGSTTTAREDKRATNAKKSAPTKSGGSEANRSPGRQARRTPGGSAPASRAGNAKAATTARVAQHLPVRADEDQWSPGELDEVRAELEREVDGLRREIERAESEIADRLGDPSDGAGDDQADTGARTFEREHEMSLANNARDLLSQNERAIGRIEAGTYGVCEGCNNPIGKARLQAFPRAALCVTCKQREERR